MKAAANWFEASFGFIEESPAQVRSLIELKDRKLRSRVNGAEFGCGWLQCPRLDELRKEDSPQTSEQASTLSEIVGDVSELHRDPAFANAIFQVASQFNLLEMPGPSVTPEEGIGIYTYDRTQGPACAIACGGGTLYRNYFVPLEDQLGQSAERQINYLADLSQELGEGLISMRNGYAMAEQPALAQIAERIHSSTDDERDALRGLLRIGVHQDAQAIDTEQPVTQAFCSALPLAYSQVPESAWEPFARLIL
ncbi:MAG: hypothetical protein CSA62_01635 [Planctomycetota bacterium]|nr:MAG: hypothetical protein CSA62_01635 [Planctomycetota bacterium]